MIMMNDKKKMLTQILGADPREKKKEEGASDQDALSMLAQELIDAVSAGDSKGAASALRACVSECTSSPSGDASQEG